MVGKSMHCIYPQLQLFFASHLNNSRSGSGDQRQNLLTENGNWVLLLVNYIISDINTYS